jgi:hypothetical protein
MIVKLKVDPRVHFNDSRGTNMRLTFINSDTGTEVPKLHSSDF